MSTKEIITEAGADVDIAVQIQEQQAAFSRFMRDAVEVMDAMEIGQWSPPPGYESVYFIRCGRRDNSGGMPPACARLYHQHRGMGAKDAPKGMRPPIGFESDADRGVYVWYTREIWNNIQTFKAGKAARQKASADRVFDDQLSQFGAVEIKAPQQGFDVIKRKNR